MIKTVLKRLIDPENKQAKFTAGRQLVLLAYYAWDIFYKPQMDLDQHNNVTWLISWSL